MTISLLMSAQDIDPSKAHVTIATRVTFGVMYVSHVPHHVVLKGKVFVTIITPKASVAFGGGNWNSRG